MGSFWGLDDTGKNAKGRLGEIPNWAYAQMTQNADRSNDLYGKAQGFSDQFADYNNQRLKNGFGTVQDIQSYGKEAMPGLADYMNTSKDRLNAVGDSYGGVPQWDQMQRDLGAGIDTLSGMNQGNFGAQQDALRGSHNYSTGVTGQENSDVIGNIQQGAANIGTGVNDLYGGLRRNSSGTYDNLGGDAGNAYSDAQSNLSRLGPGGDMAAAAAARGFTPAIAATYRRLRGAGIDPNSSEATEALQRIDASRGRAMDDVYSKNYSDFVQQKNALGLGANQAKQQLKLGQLGNDQTLAETQGGLVRQANQSANDAYRKQLADNLGTNLNLEDRYNTTNLGQMDTAYQRSAGIQDQRNGLTQLGRQQALQDWTNRSNLLREQTANDQQNLGLQDLQYQRGVEGIARNNAEKTAGATGLQQISGQDYGLSQGYDRNQLAAGNQAFNQYGTDLGVESANAGWGKKLIAGAAGTALNLVAPGAGTILTGAINGYEGSGTGYGGGSGGYGASSGYGGNGATPPFMGGGSQQANPSNPSAGFASGVTSFGNWLKNRNSQTSQSVPSSTFAAWGEG